LLRNENPGMPRFVDNKSQCKFLLKLKRWLYERIKKQHILEDNNHAFLFVKGDNLILSIKSETSASLRKPLVYSLGGGFFSVVFLVESGLAVVGDASFAGVGLLA
jgi:hypothetical protein